jgi:RHS repeat-associated protein
MRYLPYGEERWTAGGAQPTDFTFTGQRVERGFGLMDYQARYYDPRLGRFVSADTVVPEPGNPQAWNRYAYVTNNPLRYNDPSGHGGPLAGVAVLANPVVLAGLVAIGAYSYHFFWSPNAEQHREAFAATVVDVGEAVEEGVGTIFRPPQVPPNNLETFPEAPPDPMYIPGPTLDTPEWQPVFPGPPLDDGVEAGIRPLDFPLEQLGAGDNVLISKGCTVSKNQAMREFGLSKREFNRAIHDIKKQVEGNPDMLFDLDTGDVIDQRSGEWVGNLLDYKK